MVIIYLVEGSKIEGALSSKPRLAAASYKAISDVEVSISTDSMLNDLSTEFLSIVFSFEDGNWASVKMKQSNVAIFGWIIPAPFAIAPIVIFPIFTAISF